MHSSQSEPLDLLRNNTFMCFDDSDTIRYLQMISNATYFQRRFCAEINQPETMSVHLQPATAMRRLSIIAIQPS